MNSLAVRGPVSMRYNYWGQKHFTFFFQIEMSVQSVQSGVLLNSCIAWNEFIAGSTGLASFHCCANPRCLPFRGQKSGSTSGLLLHPCQAPSPLNAFTPLTMRSGFPLCHILRNSETISSYLTETMGRKLAPGNTCSSLILVVVSDGDRRGRGNLTGLWSLPCFEQEVGQETCRGRSQPQLLCASVIPLLFSRSSRSYFLLLNATCHSSTVKHFTFFRKH